MCLQSEEFVTTKFVLEDREGTFMVNHKIAELFKLSSLNCYVDRIHWLASGRKGNSYQKPVQEA